MPMHIYEKGVKQRPQCTLSTDMGFTVLVKCSDLQGIMTKTAYAVYTCCCPIIIGYWFDMEIYVQVLVRSNSARCQRRNITYPLTYIHLHYFCFNRGFGYNVQHYRLPVILSAYR